MGTSIDIDISEKVLSLCLDEITVFIKDETINKQLELALSKTLAHGKGGKVSPAIYPVIIATDLNHINIDLAYDLAVICAFFHTYADLTDDIEDRETKNPVINNVGQYQAINITNLLLFIANQLIGLLQIEGKNKINLFNLFSGSGVKMVSGQYYDIATTNTNFSNDFKSISEKKAGAEFACFLSSFLVATGENSKHYYNLGVYYGALSQVFSDFFDIWGKPFSQDLVELKKSLPLLAATEDKGYSEKIRFLLAGNNDLPEKQLEIRRLISQTLSVERFEAYVNECKKEIDNILKFLPNLKILGKMIKELFRNSLIIISSLKELRKISKNDNFSDHLFLRKNISTALDYLKSSPCFYENTWENQRTGFLNEPILIGNILAPSQITGTKLAAGEDISEDLKYLLNLRAEDGWHRYTNDFKKIPPDADVLGQILNLCGTSQKFTDNYKFTGPLQILEENLEDSGFCPTWICDEMKFIKKTINKTMFGNECIGVMANLYYGLFRFNVNKYRLRILKGINYIVSKFDKSENSWESTFYNQTYTFYLVSRLLNAMGLDYESLNLARNSLVEKQFLNGSWTNSPQETAFALLGLLTFPDPDPVVIKTGLRYLQETQSFDGSWAGEDFYLCPGPNGRFTRYNNAGVTTAFCLRALLQGKNILSKIQKEIV
jgi:geranylgeranyl pyrophosphate synthase